MDVKYVPMLRVRQQEVSVLKSFDFGARIYPCLEIIKELDRQPPKPKANAKPSAKPKKIKKFEEVYLPLIKEIKAEKVFVDLPVHLKDSSAMKKDTLGFLRTVVALRAKRTEYIKRLSPLADKIIPVISTYHGRTGERNSIKIQESELRPPFKTMAFRTFPDSFFNDISQIEAVAKKTDFIIMDWGDSILDLTDDDQQDIVDKLKTVKCNVIIHRNSIPKSITNVGLVHNSKVRQIDNSLLDKFSSFAGKIFSDYSGIKKDEIGNGGTISPGFTFYDAVENSFYGYKGARKDLSEFELTIVPGVISSSATRRMGAHALDFLGTSNIGWKMINRISSKLEPGKSPGKFKRIGVEHYLYCLKLRIENGDFD